MDVSKPPNMYCIPCPYVADFINRPTCVVCSFEYVSVFNMKKNAVRIVTYVTTKSAATSGNLQLLKVSTDKFLRHSVG